MAQPAASDGTPPGQLTVPEFLAWVKDRPGRFELHDGQVVAMSPERIGHAATKFAVQRALYGAVQAAKLPCHVLPDGVAVHVDDKRWYEPDAMLYCGARHADADVSIDDPIVVVEVTSPSTARFDEFDKIIGYFKVPTVHHYLIVPPTAGPVIHHQRQADGTILTRIVATGPLRLDSPGLDLDPSAFFA